MKTANDRKLIKPARYAPFEFVDLLMMHFSQIDDGKGLSITDEDWEALPDHLQEYFERSGGI